MKLDKKDEKIIEILRENGRTSYSQLAKAIGLSDVAVKKRLDNLLYNNVIYNISAKINWKKIGYNYEAVVGVKTMAGKTADIASHLSKDKRILSVYAVVGEFDLIARLISKNMDDIRDFVENKLSKAEGILEVRTSVVFSKYKEE